MTDRPERLSDFASYENENYELFVARPDAAAGSDPDITAMFEATGVDISGGTVGELEEDTVVLFHDGELVTVSPLRKFTYLNDRITAGVRQTADVSLANITLPSVLVDLAGRSFDVTHSSARHPELLFTTVSRCIEAEACKQRQGQLRVGMQRLSRLTGTGDSQTRAVYEQLAETDVDVHVYGIPDAIPPSSLNVTIHGDWTDDFARNWFVVYQPSTSERAAAFIAHERDTGQWHGHWTFDEGPVEQLARYLEQNL